MKDEKLVIIAELHRRQWSDELQQLRTKFEEEIIQRIGTRRVGYLKKDEIKADKVYSLLSNENVTLRENNVSHQLGLKLSQLNFDIAKKIGAIVCFSNCFHDDPVLQEYTNYLKACPLVNVSDDSCGHQNFVFNTTNYHIHLTNKSILDFNLKGQPRIASFSTSNDITDLVNNGVLENIGIQTRAMKGLELCERATQQAMTNYAAVLAGKYGG